MLRRILLLILLISAVAMADDDGRVDVTVTATAPTGDRDAAQHALHNAETDGVLQVLERIGATSPEITREILPDQRSYVLKTEVIDQYHRDGAVVVEAVVTVNERLLRAAAARILVDSLTTKPQIMLIIAESQEATEGRSLAEIARATVAEVLAQKGFEVVPADSVYERYTNRLLVRAMTGGERSRRLLALDSLAETPVLLVLEARVDAPNPEGAVLSCATRLQVFVCRGSDGREIDSWREEAVVNSMEAATGLEMSTVDAVTKVAPRIAEAAVLTAAPETVADHMILTILKPADKAFVEQFCADPATWQGQTSPEILYCSTTLARLYVPFSGSVEEFVAALQKTRFAGLPLRITQIVERQVTVESVTD